jgi:parallel beta-helix repeat protein
VVFPANKVICINDSIETPENIELFGNGCTIKLIDLSTINHEGGFFYIHDNCYAHDLKFDGNMMGQTPGGGAHGLPAATNGVMLYTGVRFENNEVFNIGAYSLYTYTADHVVINHNTIHDTWQYCVALSGEGFPTVTDGSDDVTITNNTIYKCGEVAIKLRQCSTTLVEGNTITVSTNPNNTEPTGVRLYSLDGPTDHITVRNNTIAGEGSGSDVGISSDDENNTNITITGNQISKLDIGITLNFNDPIVTGNTLSDCRTACIQNNGSGGTLDNTLINCP